MRPSLLIWFPNFYLQLCIRHTYLDITEPPKYYICKTKTFSISSMFLFLCPYFNSVAVAQHGTLGIIILVCFILHYTPPNSHTDSKSYLFYFLILLKCSISPSPSHSFLSPLLPSCFRLLTCFYTSFLNWSSYF